MKTWNATAQALLDAAQAGTGRVELVQLLYIGFTVPQRYALAGHDKVWGGFTWTALDILVEELDDAVDANNGLRFSFPGVTSGELALALGGDVEGSAVSLYLAVCNPADGTVADAQLRWGGAIDVPGWSDGAQSLVHFTAEHRSAEAARPKPVRYTNDAQQRLYPGDTFFDYDPGTDTPARPWPNAGYFRVPV